jgi:hypothetical protein
MAAILSIMVFATQGAHAADPAVKCGVGKLKEAGKYSQGRFKAHAKSVSKGEPADYTKCDTKLAQKWAKLEEKGGADCPSLEDLDYVQGFLTTCADNAVTAAATYGVVFSLDLGVDLVAIQWDVDYSGAPGGFSEPTDCTFLAPGGLGAATDDGVSVLGIAIIGVAFADFSAPVDLVVCSFDSTGPIPTAGDFSITILDAADLNGQQVPASVGVASITAQ